MNPVAADRVKKPEEYKWSSYLVNAWGGKSSLTPHDEYLRPGSDSQSRCFAYRELFKHHLPEQDIHRIEKAAQYCQPLGDERFRHQIEEKYGIKLGQAARGKPRKAEVTG